MRTDFHDRDVIDAEFRVVRPAPFQQFNVYQVRTGALLLAPILMLLIGGGTYLGYPLAGWSLAMVVAAMASLITPHHKHLALPTAALGLMLGLMGCSPAKTGAATEAPRDQAAIEVSIREATRYRDPREGWRPKPMLMPGASQPTPCAKEGCDGSH